MHFAIFDRPRGQGLSRLELGSLPRPSTLKVNFSSTFIFSSPPSTYDSDTITMSPTKKSSRPRKVSAQKKKKSFKQRKIPKPLYGVASDISSRIFNLLTNRILAIMLLRSHDGRFSSRRRKVSHPRTCL